MKTNSLLFSLISSLFISIAIYGQTKLECKPLIPVKNNAPIVMLAKLQHTGKILRGYIELKIKDYGSIKSPDIVLTPGAKQIQILLPSISFHYTTEKKFRAFFHSKKSSIDLGTFFIRKKPEIRTFQILSNVPLRDSRHLFPLKIEQYEPRQKTIRQIRTKIDSLPTSFFPTYALGYSICDIVFLHSRYIQELSPKQRQAIIKWVKMGGSIFVVVFPITYQMADIAFFNELLSTQNSIFPLKNLKKILKYKGLGRVVFWNGSFAITSKSKECRETVGFLWKFTAAQLEIIKMQRTWSLLQQLFDTQLEPQNNYYVTSAYPKIVQKPKLGRMGVSLRTENKGPLTYEVRAAKNPGLVIDWVLPKTIRVIPTSLLIFLLLIFLIIVGPVDYYVLGLLRKRILTWIFFPLVTLSFLLFTMQLAKYYLGESEVHRYIDFVDINSQNEKLRCNRLQIYFAPTVKTISSHFNNSMWSIIDHRKFSRNYNIRRFNQPQSDDLSKYYIKGRFPTSFTVEQRLNQWEPLVTKSTIGQSKKDEFSVKIFPNKLKSAVEHWGIGENIKNWRQYYQEKDFSHVLSFTKTFYGNIYLLHKYHTYILKCDMRDVPLPMLVEVSRRQQLGYFSVVSQISPTPGANLEDLSILDPTNPRQWLFIFVTKKGGNYVVYRRFIVKE